MKKRSSRQSLSDRKWEVAEYRVAESLKEFLKEHPEVGGVSMLMEDLPYKYILLQLGYKHEHASREYDPSTGYIFKLRPLEAALLGSFVQSIVEEHPELDAFLREVHLGQYWYELFYKR